MVCLVDDSVTEVERSKLAREIVAAKCRYVVCWGYECSLMEGSIDCAYIETDENFSPPEETFLMTTCHEEETIENTIEFWWMNTSFDFYCATRFAVLVIGGNHEFANKTQSIIAELSHQWNSQEPTQKRG